MSTQFALDVASYIQSIKSGKSYEQFRVTANNVPDTADDVVTVFDTGGYSPERYHGTTAPTDRVTAQVSVRSRYPSASYLAAIALYHDLDGLYGHQMNNHTYIQAEASNPPVFAGVVNVSTHGQAYVYTLNLYAQIRRS